MYMPIVDWNGNGRIDPEEIALGLAIAKEAEQDEENEDENLETQPLSW